jgi:hypothetical protein
VVNRAATPTKFFYQATMRSAPETKIMQLRVGDAESSGTSSSLTPNAAMRHALSGARLIDEIAITINPPTLQMLRDLRLRIWWDGANNADNQTPAAVDMPLLGLTGQFFDARSMRSAGTIFDGKTLRLRWPMVFAKGALIEVFNGGNAKVSARLQVVSRKRRDAPHLHFPLRFCAAYGSARTRRGQPVPMLSVTGAGAFVGLALGIEPAPGATRRTFSYLEGNEIITADSQRYEGTGTEDFFNSAWYFPDQPFAFPFHGLTFKSASPPRVSAYRLMIPDAVPFRKSLKFEFEHGNGNNSDDLLYRWVAFWYQKPPLQFQVTDALGHDLAAPGGAGKAAASGGDALGRRLLFAALGLILFVLVIRAARRAQRPSSPS